MLLLLKWRILTKQIYENDFAISILDEFFFLAYPLICDNFFENIQHVVIQKQNIII